ncbi:MAG: hypothetical protein R2713_13230 [Ilumatobacteraceae bacterium]
MNVATHMRELEPDARVEHRRPGIDVDDTTVDLAKAGGTVHPGVHRQDAEGADDTGEADRDEGGEVDPWRQPIPAVQVDAEEDRLDEERNALQGEGQADHVAVPAHEPGPQHAHLEAEDRARHGTDGEQHGRRLGPPLGQAERDVVVLADAATMQHPDHHGQRHAERGEHDVRAEREGHLPTRREQCVRFGGQEVVQRGGQRQVLSVEVSDTSAVAHPTRLFSDLARR